MAQIRIKNLTQHRIYVPVPVGIMMQPAQEVILNEVSDDLLAQSRKISVLIEKRVIQVSIQTNDPTIDDSLEYRFVNLGGGVPMHALSHADGGVDALDVVTLRSSGGGAGDLLVSDGAGGLAFAPPGVPGAHNATHKNGGSDEIATATPTANAIPKADGTGALAGGWVPYGTTAGTATEGDDARLPSTDQAGALTGTSGVPSGANPYVTDADARLTDSRTPNLHGPSHQAGGLDPIATPVASANAIPQASGAGKLSGDWVTYGTGAGTAVEGDDSRVPTQDENNALQGTDGTPDNTNRYVTDSDARLTDARAPTAHASSHSDGAGDEIDVGDLGSTSAPTSGYIPTSDGSGGLNWQTIGVPATHAGTHQDGGADEVGTATPVADGVVKAKTDGKLAYGWLDVGTGASQVAAGDDTRIPTQSENDALVGTSGSPGSGNAYVTDSDSRLTDARTPTAHASSHAAAGADEVDAADLASDSAPATGYVLTSAAGDTCVWSTPSAPGAHASTHSDGGADEIDASDLGSTTAPASGYILQSDGTGGLAWATAATPGPHKASHQDGGADEIATTTAANGAIPKANASGTLDAGWIDDTSHGTRGGGTLHPAATTSVDGFMSAADKTAHVQLTDIKNDKDTEPQGFVDRSESTISFTDGTRTFSITPTGVDFTFWSDGTRYVKSTAQTVVLPNVEGVYYVHFDQTGTLVQTTTYSDELYTRFAYVAVVYWDQTDAIHLFLGDKRHGITMDGATNLYLRNAINARWVSGLALGDMTADGDGNVNASAQFSISNGVYYAEDIKHEIEDDNPQDLATSANIPIYFYSGAGVWRKKAADNFPVIYSGTGGYSGSLLPYNEFTLGNWVLTEATTGQIVLTHYFACSETSHPIIGIVGRAGYDSILAARNAALDEVNAVLTDFATRDFVYVATVAFETNASFTNTPRARVRAVGPTEDYFDWRGIDRKIPTVHVGRHENGGDDELNVGGLSGVLADPQTPVAHSASHKHAGGDEIATTTPAASAIPKADGTGKISSGWLPAVTPASHAASHQDGGSDPLAVTSPAASAIPKADGTGKLDGGWIPYGSSASTAVEGNDTRVPTQSENDALQGTAGTASATNRYVTDADSRMSDDRDPNAHASSHQHNGLDEIATALPAPSAIPKSGTGGRLNGEWIQYGTGADTAAQGNDTRIPSQTENDALQGTSGGPSGSNRYVTDQDLRLSDARSPVGSASGQLGGTYPGPDVRGLRETSGPTLLSVANIPDGLFLKRTGSSIIGAVPIGAGDVVGPASTTDDAVVRFDGTTGKQIQTSTVSIDDSGNVTLPVAATVDGRDVSADGSTLDTHVGDTANPHGTDLANLGTGTLAELNSRVTNATLDDSSSARTPTSHSASHEDGGSDQLDVGGLSGTLADPQTPAAHASSHQDGGADPIATTTAAVGAIPKADGTGKLDGGWIPAATPISHASTHENGQADEINVAGLSGLLADPQTPSAHASSHQDGGADPIATTTAAAAAIPKAGATGILDPAWTAVAQTVTVAKSGGDYTSIKSAVDSITDAASNKPYIVYVYPGEYTESPFAMKQYVSLVGSGTPNSVRLVTNDNNAHFITLTYASWVENVRITGPTGTGFASLYLTDGSFSETSFLRQIYITGSYYGIFVTSSGISARLVSQDINWIPTANVENIIRAAGNASTTVVGGALINAFYTAQKMVAVTGTATCSVSGMNVSGGVDNFWVDGNVKLTLTNTNISNATHGIHVSATVGPADLTIIGCAFESNSTYDVYIEASDAVAQVSGVLDKSKINVNAGANFTAAIADSTTDEEGQVVVGELWLGTLTKSVPLRSYSIDTFSTGLVSGGAVTRTTGLSVQAAAGIGYINTGTGVARIEWSTDAIGLTANSDVVFIYVDNTGSLQQSTSINIEDNVLLAVASTSASAVVGLSTFTVPVDQAIATFRTYAEEVVGPIHVSGVATTEHSSPSLQLAVDAGSFYIATTKQSAAASAPITFNYWYRKSGGGWNTAVSQTVLDPDNYDDGSGTLQSVTTSKFTRQLLFVTVGGDGTEYHVVYGQEEFNDQTAAENGNNPVAPEFLSSSGLRLASVVLEENTSALTSIVDQRPRLGQLASGTTSVTDHGLLSGLNDNDHPQYELATQKGTANGYAPLDSSSEVPAANLNLSSTTPTQSTVATGVIGTSEELARADHKHNVSVGTPGAVGTANAEGSATSLSRSDHVHDHGAQTSGTLHAAATESVNGFLSAADKAKLNDLVGGTVTGEPTGFASLAGSSISFVDGTRTFTIAPTGGNFTYYRHGESVTKTTENVVISDTTGLWFIYYDATATLTASLTSWNLSIHVPVATVYWNATTATGILGEERHGISMSWATHQNLHRTQGTRYVNGLDISGYAFDTDSDAAVQFGLTGGVIADEDLFHSIIHSASPSNPFEQILSDPAELPVFHRTGGSGEWVSDTATTLAFKNTASGRVNYNLFSATWQQAEATDGYFVAYWVMATNHINEPIVVIQGQREDATLNDAKRNNQVTALNFGDLPFSESRFLYRIIIQTDDAFGGTGKAKIQNVEDYRGFNGALAEQLVNQTLSGLTGLLADPQVPLNHSASHQHTGSDEIATATPTAAAIPKADGTGSLDSWVTHTPLSSTAPVAVTKAAASAGSASDAARQDHKHDVTTAAPSQGIGGGNTEGSATSLSRSDHDHALRETGGPTDLTIGSIADGQVLIRSGSSLIGQTSVATDELVGISASDTTPGYLSAKIVDGNGITTSVQGGGGDEDLEVAVDFATSTPANVTKAAASIGTAPRAAREDHKHDITTAAASGLSATTTNAEGSNTSLSRSDHSHAIDVATGTLQDINAGDTSQGGTAAGLARRDHQHAVETGTAVGLSAATTNAEGGGTALSRAAHTHALDVTTGTIQTVNAGDAASNGTADGLARRDHQHAVATGGSTTTIEPDDSAAEGTSVNLAREDHQHAVVAAAPAQGIGGSNAEGSASSFARSDHDHTVRETSGPTDLTVGGITDGYSVRRSGSTLAGVNPYDPYRTIVVATQAVGADATSIADALTAAAALSPAPSASAPATILVHPGVYTTAPFALPSYVSLRGVSGADAAILQASTTTSALCTMNGNNAICGVTLKSADGAGGIGVDVGGTGPVHVTDCKIDDCTTGIQCSGAGKFVHIEQTEISQASNGLLVDTTGEAVVDGLTIETTTTGVRIGTGNGTVSGNNLRVESHAGETWHILVEGSSAVLTLTGSQYRDDRTSFNAGATVNAQHMSLVSGDEALQVTSELHVGTELRPRETAMGGGDSHTRGMVALRNTNLEAGTWSNITDELAQDDASTAALFVGTGVGNAFYLGGDVQFPGQKIEVSVARLGGAVVLEYWNGSAWTSLSHLSSDSDSPYRQYAQQAFLRANTEQIRFGEISGWATKSLNGVTKYWIRWRVTTTLTTAPTADRVKLHTNRTEINSDGVVEYFGAAEPVRQLIWHRSLLEEMEGFAQPNNDVDIASGLSIKAKSNKWQNGNKDGAVTLMQALPGIDTSRPITYEVGWYSTSTDSGNVEIQLDVVTINPGDVLDGTLPYTAQISQIVNGPFTAGALNVTTLEFTVPNLTTTGTLALALYRDAGGGNLDDTLNSDAVHVYSAVYGTFWR